MNLMKQVQRVKLLLAWFCGLITISACVLVVGLITVMLHVSIVTMKLCRLPSVN